MTPTSSNVPQPRPGLARGRATVHQCPACGSTNVRRSTLRERERDVGEHKFHSPYRCRACSERFWVVSRKARAAAVVAVACSVGLALLIAFLVVSVRDDDAAASGANPVVRADDQAPNHPEPELKDPLRATDLPRPGPPPPRATAAKTEAKTEAQPLRPPAQPFVK
jgi:ribosomal protein L37AE/L43A